MDDLQADRAAFATAERLLGAPLALPLGPGEPPSGADFRRLATRHTFGDSWTRTGLDVRSRALVSVTIAATLGTLEPLRGQLRIALNNGVTKDEIVDLFIHLGAYAETYVRRANSSGASSAAAPAMMPAMLCATTTHGAPPPIVLICSASVEAADVTVMAGPPARSVA